MKVILPQSSRELASKRLSELGWDKKENFSHTDVASIITQCVESVVRPNGVFHPDMVGAYWLGLADGLKKIDPVDAPTFSSVYTG